MPHGTRRNSPGGTVSASGMAAARSMPAAPGEKYSGSDADAVSLQMGTRTPVMRASYFANSNRSTYLRSAHLRSTIEIQDLALSIVIVLFIVIALASAQLDAVSAHHAIGVENAAQFDV